MRVLAFVATAPLLCLAACSPAHEPGPQAADAGALRDAGQAPVAFDHDFFPFFAGSRWVFEVTYENHGKSQTKSGWLGLTVADWDTASHVATLSWSKFFVGEPAEYQTVRLRKEAGRVEVSTGAGWQPLVNTVDPADPAVSFLLAGAVAKPGGFFGSVKKERAAGSVATGAGTFETLRVEAEYLSDRNDPYTYQDRATEHWAREVGLVHASSHYYDAEMGYPYILSVTETFSLSGYLLLPPGAAPVAAASLAGPAQPPSAPADLEAQRTSSTRVALSWKDQSLDETAFVLERRMGLGFYEPLASIAADVQAYSDATLQEADTCAYRLRAENGAGASAFTPEVRVNVFGVPQAPAEPSAALNTGGLKHVVMQFWLRTADQVTALRASWRDGSRWQVLDQTTARKTGTVVDGRFIETLFFCNDGGVVTAHPQHLPPFCSQSWPSGTHAFRVQAINAYGASFDSEEATVEVP